MSTYGSRDLIATTNTDINADTVFPFFAVELLFSPDPTTGASKEVRLWTGQGDITAGLIGLVGKVYTGVSSLLSISTVDETSDLDVKGASITLSGITDPLLTLALSEPYQGRVANIYFGTSSAPTNLNPIFSGYMDQMNISEAADSSLIELQVENKLVDLERPRVARFTSGYQKSKYPTDKGLDFIEDMQDRKTLWNRV
jgi:hypothetical protein|tara:strand:- start:910 stop:1506 length:597 start_codon:yes stop_codon:yes gene_type:complete